MKRFLTWLTGPDVAPLVARLVLVLLTSLAAEPEVGAAFGAGLETAGRALVARL